jgi:large subunit ribosomal protein L14e
LPTSPLAPPPPPPPPPEDPRAPPPPSRAGTRARTRSPAPSPRSFSRFVEVGRVVLINYGPDEGKLATIIDIVDGNKCLVDGPATKTGVARQVIPFKRVALTDIVVKIPKNARQKTLNKAWDEADVLAKWDASSWAKKLAAKKKRASLTDFQRFQLMVARKQRSAIVAAKVKEMS